MVITPVILSLIRIVTTMLGFLPFQMNLKIVLSMSLKNCLRILMGIALLILPFHEHGRSMHVLCFSKVSFMNVSALALGA